MYYPNRLMCSTLDEMRDSLKLLDELNIKTYRSHMSMLIEEVQSMANRMEAAISDKSDVEEMIVKRRQLKKEIKKLKIKRERLNVE